MLWKSVSKKYNLVCFFPNGFTSQYHDNCIPPKRRQQTTQTTEKAHKEGDYSSCDAVTQDRIWKQSVGKEGMCLKNWYVKHA